MKLPMECLAKVRQFYCNRPQGVERPLYCPLNRWISKEARRRVGDEMCDPGGLSVAFEYAL